MTQAGNNGLSGGNPLQNQVNVKLQGLVKDAGNLEHMFVVDLKGTAVADSDTKLVGDNFSDRNYTKNVLKTGMPVISETLKSKSTGAYILAFVHPVVSGEKMIGFVASAVRADSLVTYLADAKVAGAPSSYAYLVDETGNTLYHPDEKKIGSLVENESIKAVVEQVKAGADGTGRECRIHFQRGQEKKLPTPCSRRRSGPWC
ncbi:cache domain-containing protein [Paenibacillus rhizoplanae]